MTLAQVDLPRLNRPADRMAVFDFREPEARQRPSQILINEQGSLHTMARGTIKFWLFNR